MAIDPQVRAHYEAQRAVAASSGSAPAMSISGIRRNADAVYNDKDPNPAVWQVRDVLIPAAFAKGTEAEPVDVPVRIYTPGEAGPYPVLVYYHGGGFMMHNIQSHDSLCRNLCLACNAVVVNVGYRLAPEAPFPAGFNDCYTAFCWVYEHTVELNIKPDQMAVSGDSAGACLSLAVAEKARDDFRKSGKGPLVSLQLLFYGTFGALDNDKSPSYQELIRNNYVLTKPFLDLCSKQYEHGLDPKTPYMNPGKAEDFTDLGRVYLVPAEYDPLRDDSKELARLLKEAGNDVTYEVAPGMMHGFLLLWKKFDTTRLFIEKAGKFFRETFGN